MISDLRTYEEKSFFEKGHIIRLWKRLNNRKLTKFKGGTVKFRKYASGLIFFKGPFRGPIFGGAYLGKEICVSKSIGPAL